ncbi:MAG: hypothetical protein ABMA00_09650 [Gemmatimonas sp.]
MTMRRFFILLLLVHGSIHLLGFVKAFGFAHVDALRLPIGPIAGVGWLAAAGLYPVSAALFLVGHRVWWIPTGLGGVLYDFLRPAARLFFMRLRR